MEEFRAKFQIEKLQIKKIGSWIISLRPQQITLGSLVLSLDRKCPHLGELTEQEGKELSQAFKIIEDLLHKTFHPDKINYLALMMLDNQVHFHVIPRHENSINYAGQMYQDKDWPKPPRVSEAIGMNEEMLISLKQYLIQTFN